jgi:5-methylcytosine-specific restriction enzyme A
MSNWSKEELRDAILAYREMQENFRDNQAINKSAVYKALSYKHGRTRKAFEFRMQNISYVLSLSGRDWLEGLKPANHVGTNVIRQIEEILSETEGRVFNYSLLQDARNINAFRKKNNKIPTGNKKPRTRTIETTVYVRNSDIVAWVLLNANGICELCDQNAPFNTVLDTPFLEVHHVKHLSDNGSDTICNAVALCPNCHRELHYGMQSKLKKETLYNKIERLIR